MGSQRCVLEGSPRKEVRTNSWTPTLQLTGHISAGRGIHTHQALLGGPTTPKLGPWVHPGAPGRMWVRRQRGREGGGEGGKASQEELTWLGRGKRVKNPRGKISLRVQKKISNRSAGLFSVTNWAPCMNKKGQHSARKQNRVLFPLIYIQASEFLQPLRGISATEARLFEHFIVTSCPETTVRRNNSCTGEQWFAMIGESGKRNKGGWGQAVERGWQTAPLLAPSPGPLHLLFPLPRIRFPTCVCRDSSLPPFHSNVPFKRSEMATISKTAPPPHSPRKLHVLFCFNLPSMHYFPCLMLNYIPIYLSPMRAYPLLCFLLCPQGLGEVPGTWQASTNTYLLSNLAC